ncbi:hemolysin BL-binding protein [Prodigiosinella confusarubida]|uniref:Hemolysin BL-binding protein n=2 Tax=Serratia sp. (strain ATCC 39006) TaxID=104623 RepID=A0A2I5T7R9_SERS3|nr:hemolysin BL-binding protein [Serratia sp. ATCC 39006]AUH04946.1 hemolysin BL-binding protein [Serratia sp. ATCC 39006]
MRSDRDNYRSSGMKPVKTTQRLLSYVLIYLVAMQPLLPAMAAAVSVASGNTSLDNAGNGVPIVNIATPNAAGISHNQYNDFNVGKSGLILNNGTARLNSTQLGGLIQNNPNLNGKAADAIINEVVSSNRSTLAGYLEVAGKQANVMVANPYGITCNGCGFINIPQVTLTTGKPQFDANGQLQALDVRDGNITITGQGVDASDSDYFSLIARTATLQAGLNAKDIRVVLGANRVGSDGSVTPQTPGSAAPTLALDTSVLGGMYANRIRLVSTENGVGVNTGNLGARSGDITLAANGELTVGNVVAQGNIQLQGGKLAVQGKQQAGGQLDLQGQHGIRLQDSTLRSAQDITLSSNGQIQSTGSTISAGVNRQGTIQAGNQLTIKGDNVTINHSQLVADQVALTATGHLQQDAAGVIRAGKTLRLGSASAELNGEGGGETLRLESGVLTGSGRWQASDDLSLSGVTQGDWSGSLLAGNVLDIRAGDLTNSGTLSGGQVSLHAGRWSNSGTISGRQLAMTADSLINQGTLGAEKGVDLLVNGDFDNQGTLLAGDTLQLTAASLDNHSVINANQLSLHANSLINAGTLEAQGDADLTIDALFSQTADGMLLSGNMLTLQSGDLKTAGHLQAQQLTLDTQRWLNTAGVNLGGDGRVTLAELNNRGNLLAGHALDIRAGDLINSGTLSGGQVSLHAGRWDNSGTISGRQLALTADSLINQGSLGAEKGVDLLVNGDLDNQGTLLAGDTLQLTASSLDNHGVINANQLNIHANSLINAGTLQAQGDADLTTDTLFSQTVDGMLLSGSMLTLQSGSMATGGRLQAGQLQLDTGRWLNTADISLRDNGRVTLAELDNQGSMLTEGGWQLTGERLSNQGRLQGGTLRLDATDILNSGHMQAAQDLALNAHHSVTNDGDGLSGATLTLTAPSLDNGGTLQARQLVLSGQHLVNRGQLTGIDQLNMTLSGALDNQGMLGSNALTLSADRLANAGTMTGIDQLNMTLSGALDNQGMLGSNALMLSADHLTNGGTITGIDRLNLSLNDDLTNDGNINSNQLTVTSGSLSNSGTLLGVNGADVRLTGNLDNQGMIGSSAALAVQAAAVTQSGRMEGQTLDVRADSLDNSGTLLGLDALTLAIRDSARNTGKWLSQGDSRLRTTQLDNRGQWQADTMTANANTVTNAGQILGIKALTLTATDSLSNQTAGKLLTQGAAVLTANRLSNDGEWQAGNLTLQAEQFTNTGRVQSNGALDVTLSPYTAPEPVTSRLLGTSLLAQRRLSSAAPTGLFSNSGTVAVGGDSQFRVSQLDNQGTLAGSGDMNVRADQLDNSGNWLTQGSLSLDGNYQGGGLLQAGDTLSLHGDQLSNSGRWDSAALVLNGGAFDNQGIVQAESGGTLNLTGALTTGADSHLLSNGLLTVQAGTFSQAGETGAGQLQVTTGSLDNRGRLVGLTDLDLNSSGSLTNYRGGEILGNGASALSAVTLGNQGTINAADVRLRGTDITNQGNIQGSTALQLRADNSLINQTNGQILSGGNTGLNANQVDNGGWLQGKDLTLNAQQLTNAGTLKVQNALTLTVPQWVNSGTLQVGQADITADTIDNRGALLGLTRLALQANRITNVAGAKLYSAGDMSLKTGTLEQNGQLVALGNLQADILNPMRFASTLAAGGQLTLNVTGDLVQAGTLQGNGVTVTSSGNLTNQGKIVAGSGNSTLSAADITQTASGSIQTGNSLSLLSRGGISNQGFIGAAGDLLLRAGGVVNNTSLVYAGNNLRLFSDSLINRFGNILAGNNLWLQRDENGTANSSILNSSGTIETQHGDININTGNLTNQREGLVVTESNSSTADMPSWAGGTTASIPISWFKDGELGIAEYDTSRKTGHDDDIYHFYFFKVPYAKAYDQKIEISSKFISINAQDTAAKISSASNLFVNAKSILNNASSIFSKNNISMSGDVLNNKSYQSGYLKEYLLYKYNGVVDPENNRYRRYFLPDSDQSDYKFVNVKDNSKDGMSYDYIKYHSGSGKNDGWVSKFNLINKYIDYELIGDPITEFTPGQNYNATIQAGGSITASFTSNISNTSLQPGSGSFIPAAAIPTLARVSSLGGLTQPGDRSLSTGNSDLSLSHSSTPTLELQPGVQAAAISVDPAHPFSNLSASDLITSINQGLQQLNQQTLTDYPLPSGNNGLFVVDPNSDSHYLIHSNPKLDQLGQVDNGLFSELQGMLNQTPATQAKVETRSQLTQANQFLGSSYLLGKLNLDADHDYRFLGDATFDTRYISNALLDQTGQRYLNGLGSDLAQMQYLLDNAAQAQKSLNLQLGVSLTPDQVAGLSHSIVWWENITVNGQTVLAPKLYLAQADQSNLQGSSIVANSVSLSAGGAVTNSGSTVKAVEALAIASGDKIENSEGGLLKSNGSLNLVSLGNLTNSSATIQGNNVTLASINGDIINTTTVNQWQTAAKDGRGSGSLTRTDLGKTGSIVADNALTLQAGHDIQLNAGQLSAGQSMALSAANDITLNAAHTLKDTVDTRGGGTSQNRTQGLVTSQLTSGGDLSLSAGRDLTTEAAGLNATGDMALSAGRDLNLLSATQEQYSGHWWDRHADWRQTVSQQGTTLDAGRGLSLSAGNDINLQAAQAETNGALTAKAGNDINLLSATESQHDFFEETKVKKGLFSRSVTHNLQDTLQTTEKGTLLSSNSVALTSGHDINVQGSSVAAEDDVALTAKNNVNTAASVENYQNYEEHSKKTSGLFSGGGIGFTIGSTSVSQKLRDKAATESQSVSTLGSTGGSVRINAGQDVKLAGTDVIAARDVQLTGNSVTVDPGYDKRQQEQKSEQKTAGLTVALSGVVGSALNSAVQSIQAVRKASDGRLAALQGMKAVLSGYQAYQGTQQATNNKGASSFVGISVSAGAQHSSSSQHSEQTQSFASTLSAGNDISITARSGDITAVGSQLKAVNNVELNAAQAINLLSARNSEELSGKNSSSGGNIGVSFGLSNGGAGLSVFANVNAAKGRELGSGNSWSETTVDAGQRVGLTSGGDTNLIGAQVSGEQVSANVGGDLLVQSQQDSNQYDSKQTTVAAGGSFTFGSMTGSGYLSVSQDKMHSNFDSVQQQSGLFAGSGGYDIDVGNHTQLDGAVIGSTASADKNRLDTGTLGWSDIGNKAEFSVSHTGIGLSASPSLSGTDMLKSAALTVPSALMAMGSGGNASSSTYAAVSDGTLTVRNQAQQTQDVTMLSHDVEHANNALSPIFDKEKEQKRLQTAQLIGEIGGQAIDIVRTQGAIKAEKAAEASGESKVNRPAEDGSEKAWEDYKKALTETPAYKAAMKDYGTGGDFQRAAQAATAALTALAGGDIQKALAGASAPYLAQLVKAATMPQDGSKATASDIAANAMGHAVVGAVVAELSGQNVAAGAVGAAGGELAARSIMGYLYPGKETKDLTEAEKQSVSALATVASGLASGLAAGDTTGAASGAQAGRNAVENNFLSDKDIKTFTEKYAAAKTDAEKEQLVADLKKLDADKQKQALSTGISIAEQKDALADLKALVASPECTAKCQELAAYSISELEPVANNTQLHEDNLKKGILAGVIYALTVEKPASGGSGSGLSSLTKEQQQLIRNAETITTAKGIQNPFPRDLNEKVLWNGVKANPSAGQKLDGMNKDPRFPASAGFQKMQVTHELPDGSNITIHYQYNSNTGKAYDMKITSPQANPLQPGPSIRDK